VKFFLMNHRYIIVDSIPNTEKSIIMTSQFKITATPQLDTQSLPQTDDIKLRMKSTPKSLPGAQEKSLLDLMHTFLKIPDTLVEGAHREPGRAVDKEPELLQIVEKMVRLFKRYVNGKKVTSEEIQELNTQVTSFKAQNKYQYLRAIRTFFNEMSGLLTFKGKKAPSLEEKDLNELTRPQQLMLYMVCKYLSNFQEYASFTLMNEDNLAMVFSASLQPKTGKVSPEQFQENCDTLKSQLLKVINKGRRAFRKFLKIDFGVQMPKMTPASDQAHPPQVVVTPPTEESFSASTEEILTLRAWKASIRSKSPQPQKTPPGSPRPGGRNTTV
jgi:hypothetical protein